MSLAGKAVKNLCAVVTGGASGLGKAVAHSLTKKGYKVAIVDIPQSAGASIAAEFSKEFGDGRTIFVPADVSKDEQLKKAFAEIKTKFGHLNALVNCAGISFAFKMYSTRTNELCDLDKIQRTMDVNVIGTLNCIRYSVPLFMINEKDEEGTRGVIVNTASIAAYDGQTGQAAYAASKGAIASMTLPLARDLAQGHGPGIRVVAIAPGLFNTPLLQSLPSKAIKFLENTVPHPKRFGKPEEFAALVQHCVDNPYINGEVIHLCISEQIPPQQEERVPEGMGAKLKCGLDVVPLLERLHCPNSIINKLKSTPPSASVFVVALIIYKLATPLRYATTLTALPLVLRAFKVKRVS